MGSKGGEVGNDEATALPPAGMSFSVCGSTADKPVGGGRLSGKDRRSGGKISGDVLAVSDIRRALTSLLELW